MLAGLPTADCCNSAFHSVHRHVLLTVQYWPVSVSLMVGISCLSEAGIYYVSCCWGVWGYIQTWAACSRPVVCASSSVLEDCLKALYHVRRVRNILCCAVNVHHQEPCIILQQVPSVAECHLWCYCVRLTGSTSADMPLD